jgi:hypothetical protein
MKTSKDFLKRANIVPKLRLAFKSNKRVVGTGPHRVKILEDKLGKDVDRNTGQERIIVIYYFEKNGEKKKYKVLVKGKDGDPHYLVQRLAEIPEGQEIILEYKRSGMKGYIEVMPVNDISTIEMDEEDEDTPAISLDEDEQSDSEEEGSV